LPYNIDRILKWKLKRHSIKCRVNIKLRASNAIVIVRLAFEIGFEPETRADKQLLWSRFPASN